MRFVQNYHKKKGNNIEVNPKGSLVNDLPARSDLQSSYRSWIITRLSGGESFSGERRVSVWEEVWEAVLACVRDDVRAVFSVSEMVCEGAGDDVRARRRWSERSAVFVS